QRYQTYPYPFISYRPLNINSSSNPKPPYPYTKVFIPNAFSNRSQIISAAKDSPGVYYFKGPDGRDYVGRSMSLYNRVTSYFMPSILAKADRYVLRYFHKYGFNNVDLTLYVMEPKATKEMVIELEQYFMDTLKPSLNIDMDASSSGFHEPMSMEMRELQRELRGTPIYVYDLTLNSLVHMFNSKTHLKDSMKVNHRDLKAILNGDRIHPYLGRFIFSLVAYPDMSVDALMSLQDLLANIENHRSDITRNVDKMKAVLAENMVNPRLTKQYPSLTACAKDLNGDRATIRDYLNGKGPKPLYRGQWKFTWVENLSLICHIWHSRITE
nr:orf325 [Monoblepharella sp. JEL15]AAO64970.1 orf325 [Monoblepharella sp. JEL15]